MVETLKYFKRLISLPVSENDADRVLWKQSYADKKKNKQRAKFGLRAAPFQQLYCARRPLDVSIDRWTRADNRWRRNTGRWTHYDTTGGHRQPYIPTHCSSFCANECVISEDQDLHFHRRILSLFFFLHLVLDVVNWCEKCTPCMKLAGKYGLCRRMYDFHCYFCTFFLDTPRIVENTHVLMFSRICRIWIVFSRSFYLQHLLVLSIQFAESKNIASCFSNWKCPAKCTSCFFSDEHHDVSFFGFIEINFSFNVTLPYN